MVHPQTAIPTCDAPGLSLHLQPLASRVIQPLPVDGDGRVHGRYLLLLPQESLGCRLQTGLCARRGDAAPEAWTWLRWQACCPPPQKIAPTPVTCCQGFVSCTGVSASRLGVPSPSLIVALYRLLAAIRLSTSFVARPTHTTSSPVAMGSRVPACPTFLEKG